MSNKQKRGKKNKGSKANLYEAKTEDTERRSLNQEEQKEEDSPRHARTSQDDDSKPLAKQSEQAGDEEVINSTQQSEEHHVEEEHDNKNASANDHSPVNSPREPEKDIVQNTEESENTRTTEVARDNQASANPEADGDIAEQPTLNDVIEKSIDITDQKSSTHEPDNIQPVQHADNLESSQTTEILWHSARETNQNLSKLQQSEYETVSKSPTLNQNEQASIPKAEQNAEKTSKADPKAYESKQAKLTQDNTAGIMAAAETNDTGASASIPNNEQTSSTNTARLLQTATSLKDQGKELLQAKKHREAIGIYKQAIDILRNTNIKNQGDDAKRVLDLKNVLLNNISQCYISLEEYSDALWYADKVIITEPSNIKALYRMALCKEKKGDYKGAYEKIKEIVKIYTVQKLSLTKDVSEALDRLTGRIKQETESEAKKEREIHQRLQNETQSKEHQRGRRLLQRGFILLPSSVLALLIAKFLLKSDLRSSRSRGIAAVIALGFCGVLGANRPSVRALYGMVSLLVLGGAWKYKLR